MTQSRQDLSSPWGPKARGTMLVIRDFDSCFRPCARQLMHA